MIICLSDDLKLFNKFMTLITRMPYIYAEGLFACDAAGKAG